MIIQIPMKRNQINNIGKQKERQRCSTSLRPAQQISTSPFRFLVGQKYGASSYLHDSLAAYPDVFISKKCSGSSKERLRSLSSAVASPSSVRCLCSLSSSVDSLESVTKWLLFFVF